MTRRILTTGFTLALGFLSADASRGLADIVLTTDSSSSSPLTVAAGADSGPLALSTSSDNPPNDIVSAWNVGLEILPDAGTSGTLTFLSPMTGSPPAPPNYIFGANGLGIAVTNQGNQLTANDFFDPSIGVGAAVPAPPGANLLLLTFSASADASGLFGIYAIQGSATTEWTNANMSTQFFANVPDGTGLVRIGDVLVSTVPEPSSFCILVAAMSVLSLAARRRTCY